MIEATGIARSFGKIAKGSLRVATTVESSVATSPPMVLALPAAYSSAPLIG